MPPADLSPPADDPAPTATAETQKPQNAAGESAPGRLAFPPDRRV